MNIKDDKIKIMLIADALKNHTRLKILEIISNNPQLSHKEIAEKVGKSESLITFHMKYLRSAGLVLEDQVPGSKSRLKKVPRLNIKKIVIKL